jgi:hypothetical protein
MEVLVGDKAPIKNKDFEDCSTYQKQSVIKHALVLAVRNDQKYCPSKV